MSNRKSILAVAKEFFASKGFDGTTMDEIAEAANVNKATIYYYFKSKENLYEMALKTTLENVYNYLKERLKESNNPKKKLKAYIDAFYMSAIQDEAFLRMLMREMAGSGKHFPVPAIETFIKIVKILDDALKDGYRKGVFRRVNTKMVHLMVLGGMSYLVASAPIRQRASDKFSELPDFLGSDEKASGELYEIILRGLEKV